MSTIEQDFKTTPIFDRLMAEAPVVLDTPTPEPGTLPGGMSTHPTSAVGEHADGWPKEEDFVLGEFTSAEIVAAIEADYDRENPSQVSFTEAFQAWMADRSEERPPPAIAPVVDVPDAFYEGSDEERMVPEKTVIIVPVTGVPTPAEILGNTTS